MLKKILISILSLIVLSVGALFVYNNVRHKPVYGIIVLDKDEKKITDALSTQKKDIEKSIVLNGKWVEQSKTFVLKATDAQKVLPFNGFQKVNGSKDNYKFDAIKQISENEATLFSKDQAPLINDEADKTFSSKVYEHATLGETTAYVKSVFILPDHQYNEFAASPISLGILKVKTDASKALINYNKLEIKQLYNESRA